jgi:RecB family exonuclease
MGSVTAAEVLSPSQVSQFLNCPAKWMFRYLLDLKEPSTAATALGRAFQETIAHNFRQKAKTAQDLPVAECLDCFRKVLGPQLEEAKLQKGEHPLELLELGETMVRKYMEDAAPLIGPAAVESRVSGVIGGVKVSGYVDLLDTRDGSSTQKARSSRSRESRTIIACSLRVM